MTLRYLDSRSPALNALFRAVVLRAGGAMQRTLAQALGGSRVGSGARSSYALQMLRSPGPRAEPQTLRALLPPCEPHQALVLTPDEEPVRGTVFYFPGCGSERLYGSIGLAGLHLLLQGRTRVVLPPPFLCCGFPAWANAAREQHGRNTLRDTIVFSQIREMFAHLSFDAVVVTCGTCREALAAMDAGKIFAAPIVDVARFLCDRGVRLGERGEVLYHAPCHDPLEGRADEVLGRLAGMRLQTLPHCCSEAGTLALSRPDIADAMLHRKREAMQEALVDRGTRPALVLTSCPSCLSGLGRQAVLGVEARHVVVELARTLSGEDWQERARQQAARAEAVHF